MASHAPSLATPRRSPPPVHDAAAQSPAAADALERSMADTIIDVAQLDQPPAHSAAATPRAQPAAEAVNRGVAADRPAARDSGFDMPLTRSMPSVSAVEVTEVGHDPELDEAVISYANGDSAATETLLRALIGGRRLAASAHAKPGWSFSISTAAPASRPSSRRWPTNLPSVSANRRRIGSRCRR